MDAFEYNGTEEGVPNQPLRVEFPRSNRMPPHWRSMEGGERLTEPNLSQPRPMRARWPHAAQWNRDATEYDKDGYIVGVRIQNWPDETFMAPPWCGGAWRDMVHLPRSNVSV